MMVLERLAHKQKESLRAVTDRAVTVTVAEFVYCPNVINVKSWWRKPCVCPETVSQSSKDAASSDLTMGALNKEDSLLRRRELSWTPVSLKPCQTTGSEA